MSVKALDLISDALASIGVGDLTESTDATTANRCLRRLNAMMNAWSAQGLMVFTITRKVFPLTIGKDAYTLGTGGDFNTDRPVWFNNASIIPTASAPTLEIPVTIYGDDEWQNVSIKSINSTFPLVIHPRGDFPLNTIDVWPVPTDSCSIVLYTPEHLQTFASISDVVELPLGYEHAIIPNLAVILAPMFGTSASPEIARMAMTAMDTLRAQNLVTPILTVDSSLCGNPNGPTDQAIKSKGRVVD